MADSTVSALTAASALTGAELFYGVQSANDVKITASQIATFAGGGGTGTGDVTGPAVAVTDHVATYDGITGKLIKDGGQTITSIIASSISGSGNVVGPASAVSDHLAVFDGVTGRLIKDGGQSLSSLSLTSSQITDFSEATDDRVASLLVAGSNVTLTYNDPANTLTIAAAGGGGGGMAIGGAVSGSTSGSILFADASGNLAQQNANLFFDDPNNALKIGANHTYNIDTFRALYRVSNAGGDNWFEGDAGNPSVTGHDNFGTGSGCMQGLTTGYGNTGVGTGTMGFLTTGFNNFGFGTNTLRSIGTGSFNVAIGPQAMQSSVGVTTNVAIGINPLNALTGSGSTGNIAIGASALEALVSGAGHVGIGTQAGAGITNDAGYLGNVFIGTQAASGATGYNLQNTIIGSRAAWSASQLTACTVLGIWKGPSSALSNVIVINDGAGEFFGINQAALDWNYTNNGIWSFHRTGIAQGMHVYNVFDDAVPTVNYERAIFDWRTNSNVLTIGTQAGGTGVLRPVNIIGSALTFNGSPIGGGGGGMAIGGAVTGGTNKSILFVDASTNLAQDNANLFWDDTNNIFHIGYGMDFAGVRGFYRIPHGSGDNWFAGGSGNITLTGHDNFGFGQGTLANLSSGNYNTASGTFALSNCTTGQFNFAFGLSSLRNLTSGGNNTAIGPFAMTNATTANFNVAFGDSALNSTNGANNVAIGTNSAGGSTGSYNAFIGSNVVSQITSGDYNVVIGGLAMANSTSGIQNTLIGYGAGYHLSGGSNNTLIGGWQGPSASMSNVIALSQGNFGSSIAPVADFGYSNNGWTFVATSKAGAPAASDLPSGSFAVIDDTSGGQTWLVFNKAGTLRKVQLT